MEKSLNKKTIELSLMGQKIFLKTESDQDRAEAVVHLVRGRIQDAEKRLKAGSAPQFAALLALFDLAEEYLEAKKRIASYQNEIKTKVDGLEKLFSADGST